MAQDAAERRRVAARKRRVSAAVDREIRRRGGKPPGKSKAEPSLRTLQARHKAGQEHADALRSWAELRRAIRAEGGLRANRDFATAEIPRELRARRGEPGLAPDVAAQVLTARGFHYEGDDALIVDAQRRRERVTETHREASRARAHTGPSVVCVDACRDERGMFERCEIAAHRAVRYCKRRLRDAIGRFR